jgi:hypothetical protein
MIDSLRMGLAGFLEHDLGIGLSPGRLNVPGRLAAGTALGLPIHRAKNCHFVATFCHQNSLIAAIQRHFLRTLISL